MSTTKEKNTKTTSSPKKDTKATKTSDVNTKDANEKVYQKKTSVASAKKTLAKSKTDTTKKADEKKSSPTPAKKAPTKSKSSTTKKTSNDTKKSSDKWNFKYLGGLLFAKMMRGGASELRANAEEVNKLNVFPVPDGDTGDNMTMTIESGIAAIETNDSDNIADVIKVVSHGMLLGARGNSGVILSQFFAGIANGLSITSKADAKTMGRALELGVEAAYASVMTPTEGTILTVAREAVEYAVSRLTAKSTIKTLFADLVGEMHASLERTPELLAELKEADVVDSGGAGLFYIMDGINRVLNGEEIITELPADALNTVSKSTISTNKFGPDSVMTYGYCTELLVQLQTSKINIAEFDIEPTKKFLSEIGNSIVAFKTDSIVKIHVHTLTPEKVLEHLRQFGEFISVKIENMSIQHTELNNANETKIDEPKSTKKKNGIVAVSNGEGISNVFRDFGADEIVFGGQTNNPSTSDFIEAFKKINAEHIFVFPNNGNIVMAATQAAEIYEDAKVFVVPAKSIGAGYVAISSINFENDNPDVILNEAKEAIARITAARVSPAIRDADMNGVHVNDGDTIGIIEKDIVVSEPDRATAMQSLIKLLIDGSDRFMLTIFVGADVSESEKADLESFIADNYSSIETYFIDGGQEIYPYLIVAE